MSTLKVDIYFKQEMEKFLNLKTTSHAILIQCFVWDMGGGNSMYLALPNLYCSWKKRKFCAEFCLSTQLMLAVVQKTSQLAENQHNHCLAPVLLPKLPAWGLEPSQ